MFLVAILQCPDGAPPPCRTAGARAPTANSVAVLYFDNVTRDSADAYLADGLTEAIIVRLGQVGRLEVKSRGMVRRFRDSRLEPAAIGRQLAAAHLVSGSVRRAGPRLRVTVELVRSATGNQLWAQQFDRAGTDLLAIEEDVASAVATAIAGQLLPAERRRLAARPTHNAVAYDHFLRGHYYLARRTPQGIARAIGEYEAAVRSDPAFSAALARIAYAYGLDLGWGWQISQLSRDSLLALGNAAADRALRLDSSNADAWLGKASMMPPAGRMRGLLDLLDRAVALDPRNDEARHFRGWAKLVGAADLPAADADFRAALAIEPLRPVTLWYLAVTAYMQRRHADSRALAESSLAIDPGFVIARSLLARIQAHLGEIDSARRHVEAILAANPTGPAASMAEIAGSLADHLAADTAALRRRLQRLRPGGPGSAPVRVEFGLPVAALLAYLGEPAEAVAVLRSTSGPSALDWILLQMPEYDVLRGYPPFLRFLESIRPEPLR